ncbi:MAG: hypothetical protein HQL69_17770 [Magnetococcales bacterium]|nr:hypothetical protein [Magnetococcales bacterium]
METIGAAFGRKIQDSLKSLSEEAQRERLECAVAMFDDLRVILAEEDSKGSPTGYLTVQGWTKLLNCWDNNVVGASARKLKYMVDFIDDVLSREGMYAPPLGFLFGEMKTFLENAQLSPGVNIQVAA